MTTKMNITRYLLGCTLVAALGGFLFGFDTAVISGTTTALETIFALTKIQLGFTAASAILGTICGSLTIGRPADAFGRKPMLLGLAVVYFLSALGCGLAWDWYSLLAFRFLGGLAIGGASVVSPMYIAEISPPQIRGRLVAVSQLNVVCGVLAAYFSNYLLNDLFTNNHVAASLGGPDVAWRWMLGVVAIPSILFFFLVLPIPESPRWLVKRHRADEAANVLRRVGVVHVERVIGEIVDSLHEETVGTDEPLFQRKYRVPIMLALMIATFNQLAGINALTYYTADVFRMAGAEQTGALAQAVILGLTNLAFTLLAMSVIDRFGRKTLMMIGTVGLAGCLALTSFAFHVIEQMNAGLWPTANKERIGWLVLSSLVGYFAFFAFSQGSVIWVFLSEIFPNRVRSRGQALGSFTHWFWCALVSFSFPVIADHSSSFAFAFFSAMMGLQFFLIWRFMPETKGVSLEAIQRQLGIE